MAKTVKDLLAEANTTVPKLSPAEAAEKIRSGDVMVVDVRDPHEARQSGKIKGRGACWSSGLTPRANFTTPLSTKTRRSSCTAARVVGRRWPGKRFRTWGTRQCSTLAGSRILPRRASTLSPRKASGGPPQGVPGTLERDLRRCLGISLGAISQLDADRESPGSWTNRGRRLRTYLRL